jgi:hypothetical protein
MQSSNQLLETHGFSEGLIPRIRSHMKSNRSAIRGDKAPLRATLLEVNKLPSNQCRLKDHLLDKIITSGALRATAQVANKPACFTRSKTTITRRKKCILDYLRALEKAAYKMKEEWSNFQFKLK